mgnify:CR=1 FL=1
MSDAPGPKPWRVTASRIVHADRWIRLRADDCVTGKGAVIAPFYVLEYSDFALAAAITDDERVVLIRQYRHALGKVQRELPAGVIDPTDVDPIAAARRELREETGYDGEPHYLGSLAANGATHSNHAHMVLFTGARRVQEQKLEPGEDIVVDLVPLESLRGVKAAQRLDQASHVASLLLAIATFDDLATRKTTGP